MCVCVCDRTAVHSAVLAGNASAVALLHSVGTDVNHRDVTGRTALMYVAIYVRQQPIINQLLSQ